MKSVKEALLERRSIRRYEREAIAPEQMDLIYEAIQRTPTSYNGEQFSVIDVADQALKEQLYELTSQKQIKTCNRLLVFCADFHKMALLAAKKGVEMPPITHTLDGLILGVIDASLAMMSAVVAAEAMGLGCCCVGYIRTVNPAEVARLLRLPEGVMAVCGLTIGVPREMPDLKPKQPLPLLIHRDGYRADTEALTEELAQFDAEVTAYNGTRAGTKSDHDWCSHIVDYYREAMGYNLLSRLRPQGYDITE